MRLEEHVIGDVTVLAVPGRMTRNDDYGTLVARVSTLVDDGRGKFVIDMAGVSYMDSTCLDEIVSGLVTVRKAGGTLHLANLSDRVEQLMLVAGLTNVIQTFPSQ